MSAESRPKRTARLPIRYAEHIADENVPGTLHGQSATTAKHSKRKADQQQALNDLELSDSDSEVESESLTEDSQSSESCSGTDSDRASPPAARRTGNSSRRGKGNRRTGLSAAAARSGLVK